MFMIIFILFHIIMGVGSGEQGERAYPPWIFIYGRNIVDRGLKLIFFSLFCYYLVFFPLPPLPVEKAK